MSRRTASKKKDSPEILLAGAPPVIPVAPEPVCFETVLDEFLTGILVPKSKGKQCLLDQAFKFVELRTEATDEEGDALTTHLLGFEPTDLPRFQHNLCKTLGNILEKLIHILYRAAYPSLYSTDYASLEKQIQVLKKNLKKDQIIGKWKPDFLIGMLANEIKYRAGNGQGSTEQSWGAQTLLKLKQFPRMMFFRLSPNAQRYSNRQWLALQAEEAFKQIELETGIDIIELIRRAGEDPRVQERKQSKLRDIMRKEVQGISYLFQTYGAQMLAADPEAVQGIKAKMSELPA
jgi:hypothetical protein